METQKETKEIVNQLNSQNIPADYLFPSYQKGGDDLKFIILVHKWDLEKAKKLFPQACIKPDNYLTA